jgi:serine/threonine protein kinase
MGDANLLLNFIDIPQPLLPEGQSCGKYSCQLRLNDTEMSERIPLPIFRCAKEFYSLLEPFIIESRYGSIYEARKMNLIRIDGETVFQETEERVPLIVKLTERRKLPNRPGNDRFVFENPLREIAAMQHLRNSVESVHLMYLFASFITPKTLVSVMPYYKPCMELFEYVNYHIDELDEVTIMRWFFQLVIGVSHIHNNGYAHLDLGLENILVSEESDGNKVLTIIDYGMMTAAEGYGLRYDHLWYGKDEYAAPEIHHMTQAIVHPVEYDPRSADIWALGSILFVILSRGIFISLPNHFFLYQNAGSIEAYLQQHNAIANNTHMIHIASHDMIDLLNGLLAIHHEQRLTIDDVINHPCFQYI